MSIIDAWHSNQKRTFIWLWIRTFQECQNLNVAEMFMIDPRRGHPDTEGGGGGAHPRYVFRGRRGLFLRPPHVRDFVKRRVLFCTQVRSIGVRIPLQSTKYTRLWRRVTPEVTGLPSLLLPLATAKHAEDYKILS